MISALYRPKMLQNDKFLVISHQYAQKILFTLYRLPVDTDHKIWYYVSCKLRNKKIYYKKSKENEYENH